MTQEIDLVKELVPQAVIPTGSTRLVPIRKVVDPAASVKAAMLPAVIRTVIRSRNG
jgi:hypothetical protein